VGSLVSLLDESQVWLPIGTARTVGQRTFRAMDRRLVGSELSNQKLFRA